MSCWPPSPCDRLSRSPRRARHRPRLLRGLRPTHDRPSTPNGQSSRLDPAGCRVETDGPAGWFPRSPDHRLVNGAETFTAVWHLVQLIDRAHELGQRHVGDFEEAAVEQEALRVGFVVAHTVVQDHRGFRFPFRHESLGEQFHATQGQRGPSGWPLMPPAG